MVQQRGGGRVSVKRYKVPVMRGDLISEAGELPVGCPHSEFQASQDYIWKPNFRKKGLGRRNVFFEIYWVIQYITYFKIARSKPEMKHSKIRC